MDEWVDKLTTTSTSISKNKTKIPFIWIIIFFSICRMNNHTQQENNICVTTNNNKMILCKRAKYVLKLIFCIVIWIIGMRYGSRWYYFLYMVVRLTAQRLLYSSVIKITKQIVATKVILYLLLLLPQPLSLLLLLLVLCFKYIHSGANFLLGNFILVYPVGGVFFFSPCQAICLT